MNGNEFVMSIPVAKRGRWHIEHHTVTKADARFNALYALTSGHGRYTPAGTYVGLKCGRALIMSNAPDEISDCQGPVGQARKRGGHVLVNGLGLGWVVAEILSQESVDLVTVVEIEQDVIDLVGPSLEKEYCGRVKIVHGDAFTYPDGLTPGTRFSVVWHDIWPTISAANLPEMGRLHRRYGRRCDWQGSWARRWCERG
jgi:predicted methyltransferase